jgi:hypothetical protein
MTLVIARQLAEEIIILADTRLTEHGAILPLERGVIKTCIVAANVAVSFANSPDLAARDIARFAVQHPNGSNYITTKSFFEQSSAKTGVDYILSFARPSKILVVSEGKSHQTTTGWIGDREGFDRFRAYETRSRESPRSELPHLAAIDGTIVHKERFSNLLYHFEDVVGDRDLPSVGGFISICTNGGGKFGFRVSAGLYYDTNGQVAIGDDTVTLGASGENRTYEMSIATPEPPGATAVSYYFRVAQLGYAYTPGSGPVANECRIYATSLKMHFGSGA